MKCSCKDHEMSWLQVGDQHYCPLCADFIVNQKNLRAFDYEELGKPRKTTYEELASKVGRLVDEKQAAYGDSFGKSGKILEILYPNGIKPNQYTDALCVVRIIDKLFRIATNKDALGESPYKDIAGYGLLGAGKDDN